MIKNLFWTGLTYGDSFISVGITADFETRFFKRLQLKKKEIWETVSQKQFEEIDERDRKEKDNNGETLTFGQRGEETFLLSDYFIINNDDDPEFIKLKKELERVLDLTFCNPFFSPLRDEVFMHEAWSASCRSLCLSRQVGAAIADEFNEIISLGWNDVPKGHGGLYSEGQKYDRRCAKRENQTDRCCSNNNQQDQTIKEITSSLINNLDFKNEEKADFTTKITSILKEGPISNLLEFSRSIHAEMEAIMSAARRGKEALRGSLLFVTTMPCHMCARHIVAAGVSEVIFIEPYYKSKAIDLHGDAIVISNSKPSNENVIWFRQYGGVAPERYLKTFRPNIERKNKHDGRKIDDFSLDYLPELSRLHGEKYKDRLLYFNMKEFGIYLEEQNNARSEED